MYQKQFKEAITKLQSECPIRFADLAASTDTDGALLNFLDKVIARIAARIFTAGGRVSWLGVIWALADIVAFIWVYRHKWRKRQVEKLN